MALIFHRTPPAHVLRHLRIHSTNRNLARLQDPRPQALASRTLCPSYTVSQSTSRGMASSTSSTAAATAAAKLEWLVIAPDQAGALERRLKVRKDHLEGAQADAREGMCVVGGSFLAEHPQEGQTPQMLGSVLIMVASSREEVMARLKRDVYATGEVWDFSKVEIRPFKSAIREAL